MRIRFDQQLEQLDRELITMGAQCEDAISASMKALFDGDMDMARQAHETENEIDQKERDIENLCMKLLLQQQPVAHDLRNISSALKMISDMERIGDQASDIAEITEYIQTSEVKGHTHIHGMAEAAIRMVTDSIDSFVKKDLTLARKVQADDDTVDSLFENVKKDLIALIAQDPGNSETCLDLLMIAKYLERIGDHAVNIAEWVEYSITGTHVMDGAHS